MQSYFFFWLTYSPQLQVLGTKLCRSVYIHIHIPYISSAKCNSSNCMYIFFTLLHKENCAVTFKLNGKLNTN